METEDKVSDLEKLIEDAARECSETDADYQAILPILMRKFLPLLEVGQRMPHDYGPSFDVAKNSFRCEPDCPRCAWDAAWEKAKGKS